MAIHERLIFRCRAIASRGLWSFIATRYDRAAAYNLDGFSRASFAMMRSDENPKSTEFGHND